MHTYILELPCNILQVRNTKQKFIEYLIFIRHCLGLGVRTDDFSIPDTVAIAVEKISEAGALVTLGMNSGKPFFQ